jgi:hypothetical protein
MRWPAALLVCIPLAAAGVSSSQSSRESMRDRVREGKIGTCITGSVAAAADDRVIVLQNNCDKQVNVMLCVRVKGGQEEHFLLLIEHRAQIRHRLITPGNPPFEYRFNSCSGPYCVPPESDC